jgi:ipoprotein LpqH
LRTGTSGCTAIDDLHFDPVDSSRERQTEHTSVVDQHLNEIHRIEPAPRARSRWRTWVTVAELCAGRGAQGYIPCNRQQWPGVQRNGGARVQKRFAAASLSALTLACIAGCSSAPAAAPLRPGALPPGTAQTTINDANAATTYAVRCTSAETLTTINTGDPAAGVAVVVDNERNLGVKVVSIRNLGGFTGTYLEDLQGEAEVSMTGKTYTITGVAEGFNADSPSARNSGTFTIKVSC